MKTRPILFSTAMVQAILEGRKTMSRRVVKNNKKLSQKDVHLLTLEEWVAEIPCNTTTICPYGVPGEVLWVREMFYTDVTLKEKYFYKTDLDKLISSFKMKPSIHMPKDACRIFLKITGVEVERLQDISSADTECEGIEFIDMEYPFTMGWKLYGDHTINDVLGRKAVTGTRYESFKTLWQMINGVDSWEANPWVWVLRFERCEMPEGFLDEKKTAATTAS